MVRVPLLLALLLLPLPASATSLVLPLAPDSPRPVMLYAINYYVPANGGWRGTEVDVEAVSGFAEVETSGVNPVANLLAMEFSFPAAHFDLMTSGAAEIPFSITIDATTERIDAPSQFSLASFELASPGEQNRTINLVQLFEHMSFGFMLESAGTSFPQVGGADCVSSGSPGCVTGGFTGTVDGLALTQLEFRGDTTNLLDASFARFDLGTDGLGISWMVWVATTYPYPVPRGVRPPLVFTPEPGTAALLGFGLMVLGVRRRS